MLASRDRRNRRNPAPTIFPIYEDDTATSVYIQQDLDHWADRIVRFFNDAMSIARIPEDSRLGQQFIKLCHLMDNMTAPLLLIEQHRIMDDVNILATCAFHIFQVRLDEVGEREEEARAEDIKHHMQIEWGRAVALVGHLGPTRVTRDYSNDSY